MTTQMNFGPEWMRGGEVPKRNTQYSNFNTQQPNKNDDSSFKYPKEHMLNLYEPVDNVTSGIQHDYLVNNERNSSLSFLEKEYLDISNSDKDFSFENFTPKSKANDHFISGYKSNNEEVPLWSGGIDKYDIGNFDSFGAYLDNSIESSLEPEEEKDFNLDYREISQKSNFGISDGSTRKYQWIYRDPVGIIQGPFTALEMQGWYEAGFFENSLLVKREDVNFFESLDALILKVNNSKIPFLSPWPPTTNNLDTFNLKTTTQQSPFGNPPFLPSALPRVGNRSSPWENNPASSSSSWLSSQNDPLYDSNNNNRPSSAVRQLSQRDSMYGTDAEYQQLAMNQQMEQQYLSMLRQNQQHHFQLQQRMVQQQQQQQQQSLMQQQQQQRQHMFMNNQNFEHIVSPVVPQQPINRGWNSTPGTPGIIDTAQNPWSIINKQDEPFVPSPRRSRSPSKTQIDEETQLAFTLNSMSIVNNETPIESQKVNSTLTNDTTITVPSNSAPNTNTTNTTNIATIELTKQLTESNNVPNSSAWGSSNSEKKTLREIQSEEVSHNKKTMPSRSNTWSAVSAATKPTSYSTRSTRNQQVKTNAWETPVRQKRISTPNMPSAGITSPKSSSKHPTIKSSPKGPSEEFLKWCKLSLRELNAGVNVDDILQMLLSFPVDDSCLEIIQDIIYTNSISMDGRRFANDFISRRKADLDGKLNVVLPKNNAISSEFKVVTKKGRKKQIN